jgi:hypothetical protein
MQHRSSAKEKDKGKNRRAVLPSIGVALAMLGSPHPCHCLHCLFLTLSFFSSYCDVGFVHCSRENRMHSNFFIVFLEKYTKIIFYGIYETSEAIASFELWHGTYHTVDFSCCLCNLI